MPHKLACPAAGSLFAQCRCDEIGGLTAEDPVEAKHVMQAAGKYDGTHVDFVKTLREAALEHGRRGMADTSLAAMIGHKPLWPTVEQDCPTCMDPLRLDKGIEQLEVTEEALSDMDNLRGSLSSFHHRVPLRNRLWVRDWMNNLIAIGERGQTPSTLGKSLLQARRLHVFNTTHMQRGPLTVITPTDVNRVYTYTVGPVRPIPERLRQRYAEERWFTVDGATNTTADDRDDLLTLDDKVLTPPEDTEERRRWKEEVFRQAYGGRPGEAPYDLLPEQATALNRQFLEEYPELHRYLDHAKGFQPGVWVHDEMIVPAKIAGSDSGRILDVDMAALRRSMDIYGNAIVEIDTETIEHNSVVAEAPTPCPKCEEGETLLAAREAVLQDLDNRRHYVAEMVGAATDKLHRVCAMNQYHQEKIDIVRDLLGDIEKVLWDDDYSGVLNKS